MTDIPIFNGDAYGYLYWRIDELINMTTTL